MAAIIIQSGRLELSSAKPKHFDTWITERETSETTNSPVTTFQRLRQKLSLIWRRILKLLARVSNSSFSPDGIRPRISKSGDSRQKKPVVDIGADGSLFELYPTFETEMRGALREVPEIGSSGEEQVLIGLAKDGSGVGAALMAQAALEMEKEMK